MEEQSGSSLVESTGRALSGATDELFKIWSTKCLDGDPSVKQVARRFFASLAKRTSVAVGTNTVLTTHSSHSQAIAQLIRALEPCFPDAAPSLALSTIEGALSGCSTLEDEVAKLLRRFLLQYASPIIDSEDEDTIRDAGLKAIHALLSLLPAGSGVKNLAKEAVECRCMPDQLAVMPRSRRSLCFSVLQTAASIEIVYDESFGAYAIQCLQGESDPRCLLQLLRLLKAALPATVSDRTLTEDLFECASPYYPIQFKPPPNDVHGITREDLQLALMDVLLKTPSATLALLVETIEDSTSNSEQLEILLDLETLTLPSFPFADSNDIRHLSNTLITIHEKTCTESATPDARRVADMCRSLARRIALCTEEQSDAAFNAFVVDSLDRLTTTRAGIAYIVGLASNGGDRTWNVCWKAAWTTTDWTVLAAWCAAARATHRSIPEATTALAVVRDGIMDADTNRAPAIRAFESVLLVAPAVKGLAWEEQIRKLFQLLLTLVISGEEDVMGTAAEQEAAALSLGVLLGCVLEENSVESLGTTFLHIDSVHEFLIQDVLHQLLQHSKARESHYVNSTLSMISKSGLGPTKRIVDSLVRSLPAAICTDSSSGIIKTLDYLFEHTNGLACLAYQDCDFGAIVGALMGPFSEVVNTSFRMNDLVLPETREELEVMNDIIENSHQSVISVLRKGYATGVSEASVERVVQAVEIVFPPLRSSDTVQLSILFPLLSSVLENAAINDVPECAGKMVADFADFALTGENHQHARVHAARCLYVSIARFSLPNNTPCPGQQLIRNKINQSMLSTSPAQLTELEDALRLLALIGSAAVVRGGTSAVTADAVAGFLVELACKHSSVSLFMEGDWHVTLSETMSPIDAERVAIQVAESIGLLLSTDAHQSKLRKQRLTYLIAKQVLECRKEQRNEEESQTGFLAVASHLLCSAQLSHISQEQLTQLCALLQQAFRRQRPMPPVAVLRVMLGALIKTLRLSPEALTMEDSVQLVASTLRVFGSVPQDRQCQLLALEVLGSMSVSKHSNKETQSAVINLLSPALAHPSAVLRQAAANVRNAWCLSEG